MQLPTNYLSSILPHHISLHVPKACCFARFLKEYGKASDLERVHLQTRKVGEGKLSQHGLCEGEENVKYCIL